jgi:integrase
MMRALSWHECGARDAGSQKLRPADQRPLAPGGGHQPGSANLTTIYPARDAAGRLDLRFHDLRHTGAVLAAATGATLAELMARLGHSTAALPPMKVEHAY